MMQIEQQSKAIRVLDKKQTSEGKIQYLIECNGHTVWTPLSNLQNELEILAEYEFEQEQKQYQNQQLQQLIEEKGNLVQQQNIINQEQKTFEPEKILGRKMAWGKLKYKVKWKGLPWTDCSWELASTLKPHEHLIKEFEQRDKQKVEKKRFKREQKELQKNGKIMNDDEAVFLTEEEDTKSEKQLNELEILLDKKNECFYVMSESSSGNEFDEEIDFNNRIKQINGENSVKGSFVEDQIKEILCIQSKNNKGLQMSVSWRPRKTGILPGNSIVNSKDIFMHNPRELIRFYENNLKYVNQDINNQ